MNFLNYIYIVVLLISLMGMVVLNRTYEAGLMSTKHLLGLLSTVLIFLGLDLIGIYKGVFYDNPDFLVGIFLSPHLPLEEVLFLTLIYFVVHISYRLLIIWDN